MRKLQNLKGMAVCEIIDAFLRKKLHEREKDCAELIDLLIRINYTDLVVV